MNDETEITIQVAVGILSSEIEKVLDIMEIDTTINKRWLAIAKTDIQKGFMALDRAVADSKSIYSEKNQNA